MSIMILAVLLPSPPDAVCSLSRKGRWAFGNRGVANMWFSDFKERTLTPGGEVFIRYGLSRYISLGFRAGYDQFIIKDDSPLPSKNYLKLLSLPATVGVWFNLIHGENFSPYAYVGGGALMYQVRDGTGTSVPDSKSPAFVVPFGLGFEYFDSKRLAFALEVGFEFINDNIDLVTNDTPDGLARVALGVNMYFGRSDDDDDDNDGLTNEEERTYSTNPDTFDTEGDGLSDGEEVLKHKTDPLNADTDGDGLKDGEEVLKYTTDPLKTDSDGDGLTDVAEVVGYKTDPLKADTDGDALSDSEEVAQYKTDPLKADTDGDGLADGGEAATYKTDPLKADTDGDGLSDGAEVLRHSTDPLKVDSDGDRLSDGQEVLTYKTDPLKKDSDRGSVSDGLEIAHGTNPLDPDDDVVKAPEVGKKTILEGVTFKAGSAELTVESLIILGRAFMELKENPSTEVEISGHTDNRGNRLANIKLSLARANAVKTYLYNQGIAGIDTSRMRTKGYGPDKPIASNKSEEGRAKNRRIEITRIK